MVFPLPPRSSPPAPPERLLLCTDLDRTLLPNGPQPESPGARELFARLAARPEVTLAYVSGRDPGLVAEAIERYALPLPAWVVADVGTAILEVAPGGWQRLHDWDDAIARDWGGRPAAMLLPLVDGLPGLSLQEPERQSPRKLSFTLPLEQDGPAMQAALQERLARAGVRATVIHSRDEAAGVALLDVLPASASKLHAIRFLMERLEFERGTTLFAGDSGNDLPVLLSELRSILVANADPALIAGLGLGTGAAAASSTAASLAATSPATSLYLARGNFLGMNGNYSAGIVEGVVHHEPGAHQWLDPPAGTGEPPAGGSAEAPITHPLTHLNARGEVRMVEVGERPESLRRATAEGFIRLAPPVLRSVMDGHAAKGDVLAVARVAAIQAAKRTAELIPLCHPLPLSGVDVVIAPVWESSALRIEVSARTTARTGVEMEVLTAVQVGLLTLYDMVKSQDPAMTIGPVRLLRKEGGRHGPWSHPDG